MGEETKKEEAKVEAKPEEEKKEEEKKDDKAEEKKEEAKPSTPPPTILSIELHCVGCAKKIERLILRFKGVEDVVVDMGSNQVTIKGVVDAQALCSRIQKKTFRQAVLISPLPPPPEAAEAESKPEAPAEPEVKEVGISTVELHVNMHCEACAEQLKKKIMKMKGVQSVETNLAAAKATVTGTMTGEKLVEYVYRRTGKIAKVIPPPPPPSKPEEPEKKPEEEKPAAEEKKDDAAEKKEDEKPAEGKENAEGGEAEEAKKEVLMGQEDPEAMMKRMMYWNGGMMSEHKMLPWMMPAAPMMPMYMVDRPPQHYVFEQPAPVMFGRPPYVIGQPAPAPQMFSDENPNACSIS